MELLQACERSGKGQGEQRVLQKSDAPHWAAVQWLVSGDGQARRKSMEGTLLDPKCRYLCIYNWRGIKNNRGAHDTIQGLLGTRK